MKKCFIMSILMIIPIYGISKATEEIVKSMVPHGEIFQKQGADYSVKTKAGTKVTIEFDRTGMMDEASGLNLGSGDSFEPGDGLMALDSVAKSLTAKGHHLRGYWKLENDSKLGWVYELAGMKDEENINYVVNARSSLLISTEQ